MPTSAEEQQALQEKIKNMSPEELREFQKQQCLFCQIISGKIPSKKIYDDAQSIAILDINPAARGHILLLPKEHYGILPQVPEDLLGSLFVTAKRLSQAVLKVIKVSGTTIFVANGLAAGQKAPHVMIHIIPRKESDGLFTLQPQVVDPMLLTKLTAAVGQKFNDIMGIKKEIVNAGKVHPPLVTATKPAIDTPWSEDSAPEEKISELVPLPKDSTAPQKKVRSKKPARDEASTDRKSVGDDSTNTPAKNKRTTTEVSLDDIAALFK